jgi:hypothetical protein
MSQRPAKRSPRYSKLHKTSDLKFLVNIHSMYTPESSYINSYYANFHDTVPRLITTSNYRTENWPPI